MAASCGSGFGYDRFGGALVAVEITIRRSTLERLCTRMTYGVTWMFSCLSLLSRYSSPAKFPCAQSADPGNSINARRLLLPLADLESRIVPSIHSEGLAKTASIASSLLLDPGLWFLRLDSPSSVQLRQS